MSTKARDDVLQDISGKLDVIIAFLAARGLESDTTALVEKLAGIGFGAKVIALVAGTTENAIAIRLSRMKKKPGKKKQESASEPGAEQ